MLTSRHSVLFIVPLFAFSNASCSVDDFESPPAVTDTDNLRGYPADGLLLHWSFEANNGGSTIYDLSGNGRDGTLTNGATLVSSPWGQAASLDGINDYIDFSGPQDPALFGGATTGAFTISARVKVDDADRYNALCRGCAPNSLLSVGTSDQGPRLLGATYKPSNGQKNWPMSTNNTVSDATWTTVTMIVRAGVGTSYYIDCVAQGGDVTNTDTGLYDYVFDAVGYGFDANSWYDGEIDDLKVWNRALTATEISDLCPCDGAGEADVLAIQPPRAPGHYTHPSADYTVATTGQLETALGLADPGDVIVLADATYGTTGLIGDHLKVEGEHLWAATSGKAILQFGIEIGDESVSGDGAGAELHGLVFDIQDEADTPEFTTLAYGTEHAVIWNSEFAAATDLVVEDCVLHGNGNVAYGIRSTAPSDGFEARRLEIDGMTHFGMHIGNAGTPANPIVFEDIRVWDISDPLNPTYGAGIKVFETASLTRIHVRDVRFSGITILGSSDGTTLSNADVNRVGVGYSVAEDGGGVGIYLDNTAENTNVHHFCVGPDTQIGVNSEWDNNNLCVPGVHVSTQQDLETCLDVTEDNVFARGIDNVVEDGLIESSVVGVAFGRGTVNGTVDTVRFRNYEYAAIMFHDNRSVEAIAWPYYDDGSSQVNNTFDDCAGECSVTLDFHEDLVTPPSCAVPADC